MDPFALRKKMSMMESVPSIIPSSISSNVIPSVPFNPIPSFVPVSNSISQISQISQKGDQGDRGDKGDKGDPGSSGSNGNGFLCNNKTGKGLFCGNLNGGSWFKKSSPFTKTSTQSPIDYSASDSNMTSDDDDDDKDDDYMNKLYIQKNKLTNLSIVTNTI